MFEEDVATTLADRIAENGYPVANEGERNELRDAIRQKDLIIMSREISKLNVLSVAIENFLKTIFRQADAMTVALVVAAIDLQQNVQYAIDEINDELHLERLP